MPSCRIPRSLVIAAAFCASLRADPGTLVHDSVIDPLAHNFPTASFSVATVHGVTFQQDGVTTYKGWQYAAYYQGNLSNSSGKVAVARRQLPYGPWQTLVLNDYTFTTVDSHNDVVLGICPGDGTIHLSFDHHGHPLHYRVSVAGLADNPATTAWDASRFGPVSDHLLAGGATMGSVTYPRFIPAPSGKLLFTYRFGGSGGGDEILYEYDGISHSWSLAGQYTSRAGSYTGTFGTSTDRNSYFDNTVFDSNGRLHATWCWRETPDAGSNHDLLYAYSDDSGRTWKNQFGANVAVAGTSFISITSPGIIGWSIPQKRNYINNSAMTVDKQGRVHVVAWQLPASVPDQTTFSTSLSSNSRFIHYWRGTDGAWRRNESDLTGSRAKLSVDDDGRLFLIYGDATNIRIAAANPSVNPETDPANSWNNWAPLALSAALPAGRANTVNIIHDTARWEADRVLSVYAQETNVSGTGPTPLHILDYHVSRAAVLPVPANGSIMPVPSSDLSWTAGQQAVQHDVYFGTSEAALVSATPASPEYLGRQTATTRAPGALPQSTTRYWRVDSVDGSGSITKGRVWSFTTGSLVPAVIQGEAVRSYGGRTAFPVMLDLKDPALSTGNLVLHSGTTDGATNPEAWLQSSDFGPQSQGSHSLALDALSAGSLYYRFRITTVHGSSWAEASSILAPADDLSLWSHSALIDVSGYAGTETLTDFPVLIRISPSGIPGFAYDQMLSAPYGDLRFSTSSGTILAHEVETWDPLGTSFVWVKLPQLAPGTKLLVWWGRVGKSTPSSSPTWSAFNGIWHLDDPLGFTTDSSSNGMTAAATAIAPAIAGIIPGAAALNGTTSNIAINNAAALNPSSISVEAWVKTSSNTGTPSIFNKDNSAAGRVWQFRLNAGKPEFIVFNSSANATAASADAVNDNEFHHLCGTWDGATIRMYVDGALKGSTAFAGTLRSSQPNKAFIGRGENTLPNYFTGSIDEVRLSPVARSADWVRATFDTQKPTPAFVTAAPSAAADLDADHLPDVWEMQYFNTTHATAVDPDFDGIANLLEFAFGTDPASGSVMPPLVFIPAAGSSPGEFIYPQIAGGTGSIGTTYTASGLQYAVEISTDLSIWHSGSSVVAWSNRREPLAGGMERVGVRVIDPAIINSPRICARIRVLAPD